MFLSVFIMTIKVLWIFFEIFGLLSIFIVIVLKKYSPKGGNRSRAFDNNKKNFALLSGRILNLLLIYFLFGMLDFDRVSLGLVENMEVSILSIVAGLLFLFVFYFCIKNGYSIGKLPQIQNSYFKMLLLGEIRIVPVFLGLLFLGIPIFYYIDMFL